MALKPLLVRINGDDTGLQKALGRVDRGLKGIAIAAGAAGAAVATGFAAMAASGVGLAKQIEILSQRAAATPAEMQKLAAATRTVGVDMEKMSDILQDVNDRVGDFLSTGGGPMADFFEQIAPRVGVTAQQFKNLSGPQALQLYVDTLQKAGVNQQQMTFYLEAMSSEATRLLPLLMNGGAAMTELGNAAEAAGQIIDSEMIARISDAHTALSAISGAFDSLRLRLAAEVAPVLEMVAQRFQMLAQSEAAQQAISRVVSAFGQLADILTGEDFLTAASNGLTMLVETGTAAADAVVWLSQNVEIATVAMSGLAIALAAVGGPLTLTVAALAAALGGIAMWRGKAEDAAKGSEAAAKAQAELNAALGVFYQTGAPSAGKAAVSLANDNYKLAASSLAAAEAELAKREAFIKSAETQAKVTASVVPGMRGPGPSAEQSQELIDAATRQADAARAELEEAQARLEAARVSMDRTVRDVAGSDYGSVSLPAAELPSLGPGVDFEPSSGGIAGGLPGADQVQKDLERRLEALQNGLMTEREVVDQWYEDGLQVLMDARENELLTEAEYKERRERLEQEHQDRLSKIREVGNNAALSSVVGTGQAILSAVGQNNKKAAAAAKVLGAFEATVNAYRAASQALADPKLPWYAKVSAAGSVLAAGIGFANSIRSLSESGGGSSGGGGGGGGAGSAAATAQANPVLDVSITDFLQGADTSQFVTLGDVSGLLRALQKEAGAAALNFVA